VSFNGDFMKAQSLKSRIEEKHINLEILWNVHNARSALRAVNILREHLVSEDNPVTSNAKSGRISEILGDS
jgi:hypothetical protein